MADKAPSPLFDLTRRALLLGAGGLLALGTTATGRRAAAQSPATPAATAAATRTVTHALGTTAVPVTPQRIIALDSLTPAYLAELGVPSIGACTEGDYVPPLQADSYAGVVRFPDCQIELPYEAVLALDPDLILAVADQITSVDPDAYDRLSAIAPTVAVALTEDRVGLLADFGAVLGLADEAHAIIDAFYTGLADLALTGTFTMVALFGEGTFDLLQDNFVLVELLTRTGMRQVPDPATIAGYDPAGNRIRALSLEQLNLVTGDYLLPVVATFGDPRAEVELLVGANLLWQQLPAVQAGRVIPINAANAFGGAGLAGFRAEIEHIAAGVEDNATPAG